MLLKRHSKAKHTVSIGLDFDKTYTADPELWDFFVERAVARGHEVVIVTSRGTGLDRDEWPIHEVQDVADRLGILAIFSGQYSPKISVADFVDIWIDDTPHHVVMAPYQLPGWKKDFKQTELYEGER